MSNLTIEQIIREIKVSNTILNEFNTTFDMRWTSRWYMGDDNVWDLRNYKIVSQRLHEAILSKREDLLAFKQEYYLKKTAKDISLLIGIPISLICNHLNTSTFYGKIHFSDKVTPETEVFNCSSFTILKNLQKEYLAERFQLQKDFLK